MKQAVAMKGFGLTIGINVTRQSSLDKGSDSWNQNAIGTVHSPVHLVSPTSVKGETRDDGCR
jgi:hypothetical protein